MCCTVRIAEVESECSRQECQGVLGIFSPGFGRWSGNTHIKCLPSLHYCHKTLLGSSLGSSQAMVSLEGLMLKLKLQYFGYLMDRTDSLEKTLILGNIEGGKRRDDRGWDGWMASPTQWTLVWVMGVGDGQGSLECCSPALCLGHKESDTNERLNWTELKVMVYQSGVSSKLGGNGLNLGPGWKVRTTQERGKPGRHRCVRHMGSGWRPGSHDTTLKTSSFLKWLWEISATNS